MLGNYYQRNNVGVPTVAQGVKKQTLPQLRWRSKQWLKFSPWPRNLHMPQVQPKQNKKKEISSMPRCHVWGVVCSESHCLIRLSSYPSSRGFLAFAALLLWQNAGLRLLYQTHSLPRQNIGKGSIGFFSLRLPSHGPAFISSAYASPGILC